MSIDESQVTAAVAAVTDPELRRPLGELGMVGSVRVKRKKVTVDIALPVAHYPQVDELDEPGPPGGRRRWRASTRCRWSTAVMDEEPRARLRMLLRGEPVDGGPTHAADDDHGHAHGGQLGPRGGSAQPVHAAPLEDPDPRDLVGQGRGGQVLGHGQPGRGPGPAGSRRRDPRRRRLRVLGAEDARGAHRPADHRRPGGPARRPTASAACRWGSSSPTTPRSSGGGPCCTRPSSSSWSTPTGASPTSC